MKSENTMASVKTAISLDRELLEQIDAVARESGEPRSRILASAAREYLRNRENRRLMEALNCAYSPGEADEVRQAPERELRRRKHRELVEGEW